MTSIANIFVARDGQEFGPLTSEEFLERHRRLEFKVLDQAWREGMPAWTTVGKLIYILSQEAKGGQATAAPFPATASASAASPASTAAGDELQRRLEELQKRKQALAEKMNRVALHIGPPPSQEYRLLTPIYFSLGNKGMFADALSRLIEKHRKLMAERASLEMSGAVPMSSLRRLGIALSMAMTGPSLLEAAYHIGLEEIKERAAALGGDSVIHLEHSSELDPTFSAFVLHFRGTVARFSAKEQAPVAGIAVTDAQKAMEAVRRSIAAAATNPAVAEETHAAMEALRAELERQESALRQAREELQERERFLEESETRLFEKFHEQQVREAELDMREERLGRREFAAAR